MFFSPRPSTSIPLLNITVCLWNHWLSIMIYAYGIMPIFTSHIFKKGDRLQPINYRPISLASITCKMLEHIITSNIMQHLDKHNILHDAQHGFRKHRSTETQLIQLIDNLAHNIDNRIQTDAILLDFQKAFDKVPHQRLLYKLAYYGISPQAHNWVQSIILKPHTAGPPGGQYVFPH